MSSGSVSRHKMSITRLSTDIRLSSSGSSSEFSGSAGKQRMPSSTSAVVSPLIGARLLQSAGECLISLMYRTF